MTDDDLARDLSEAVQRARPTAPPPFREVEHRRAHARRRRAAVGTLGCVVLVAGLVVGGARLLPATTTSGTPATVDDATPDDATADAPTSDPSPTSGYRPPPPLTLGVGADRVDATGGSGCWDSGCFDVVTTATEDLVDAGSDAAVVAGFAVPDARWSVVLSGDRACARYPALMTPQDAESYRLTSVAPGATYRVGVGVVVPGHGGVTAEFRWSPPGPTAPVAWMHLPRDPHDSRGAVRTRGGRAEIDLLVGGAAVDGPVTGTGTVTAADGTSSSFDLQVDDQGCPGDRYVSLSTPRGSGIAVDGLGEGPYSYAVDLAVGGTTHHGVGRQPGLGTGDAPLTIDPPLPQ